MRLRAVSINRLEMEAAVRALRLWGSRVRGQTVRWRTDNQVSAMCIAAWKAKSLDMKEGTWSLWQLLRELGSAIIPLWIPGQTNSIADELSRRIEGQDWMLHPRAFQRLTEMRFRPTVDAFASSSNRQILRFWSWVAEPLSAAVDFFAQPLAGERLWANPPFSLMGRVLQRIQVEKALCLLIAPWWETAPWWPVLWGMQIQPPILLPRVADLFLPASTGNRVGVGVPHWETLCLTIHGDPARVAEAQCRLGPDLHRVDFSLCHWWEYVLE